MAGEESWLVPAAQVGALALKNRQTIAEVISGAWSRLRGRTMRVAVTGMAGAGKTVLCDHLTGKAAAPGYKPTAHHSHQQESGQLTLPNKPALLLTIPGQGSMRADSMDGLFGDPRQAVDGVIHMVCGGYPHLRDDTAQAIAASLALDPDQLRAHYLEQERQDFAAVAEQIARSHRHHRAPRWLLICIGKIDLYHADLEAALTHYARPHGRFAQEVEALIYKVGAQNLSWAAAPISTWRTDYRIGQHVVTSSLSDEARSVHMANMVSWLASR
jgi:GTPase SAR1 family protein